MSSRRRSWAPRIAACVALAGFTGPAAAAERVAGNVLRVDVAAGEITLLDAGRQLVVQLSPDATIRQAGEDKTLEDLKRGDRLVVTLTDSGPPLAARIVVAGPGRLGSGVYSAGAVPGFASGLNARTPPR